MRSDTAPGQALRGRRDHHPRASRLILRVYGAIDAVAGALARDGTAKERLNARDDYLYRSINDVSRLSPS